MNESKRYAYSCNHVKFNEANNKFIVYDEACMSLGFYETYSEAMDVFIKYSNNLIEQGEVSEMPDEEFIRQQNTVSDWREKLAKNEKKWEFRYNQQKKKQRELEATIDKLRKRIKELKNG